MPERARAGGWSGGSSDSQHRRLSAPGHQRTLRLSAEYPYDPAPPDVSRSERVVGCLHGRPVLRVRQWTAPGSWRTGRRPGTTPPVRDRARPWEAPLARVNSAMSGSGTTGHGRRSARWRLRWPARIAPGRRQHTRISTRSWCAACVARRAWPAAHWVHQHTRSTSPRPRSLPRFCSVSWLQGQSLTAMIEPLLCDDLTSTVS